MFLPWIRTVALIVSLFGVGWACASAVPAATKPERPIRSLSVAVPDAARDEFLERVRKFADAAAFAVRVGPTRPDGRHFLIQLWREDVKVIGVNPFDDAGKFTFSFFQNDSRLVPKEIIDALLEDFKRMTSNIAGITVSESR
jgi:hypothetical protein